MHHAARSGGEVLHIPLLQRRQQPLPLFVRTWVVVVVAMFWAVSIHTVTAFLYVGLGVIVGLSLLRLGLFR